MDALVNHFFDACRFDDPEFMFNFHEMQNNKDDLENAYKHIVNSSWIITMEKLFNLMIVAFSPLTCTQLAKLPHNDARIIWLYTYSDVLDHIIQIMVYAFTRQKHKIPLPVVICAAWISTCRTTCFLQMPKIVEAEWQFPLRSHDFLYACLQNL